MRKRGKHTEGHRALQRRIKLLEMELERQSSLVEMYEANIIEEGCQKSFIEKYGEYENQCPYPWSCERCPNFTH